MTTANIADTVHISDAGRARAASQEQPTPAAENGWHRLAEATHRMSEEDADKVVSDMSYASDGVLVSLEDYPTLRLTGTGQVVTPADMDYFYGLQESVRQGRIALYESEKAKGTPAAEIMDKVEAYMGSQPTKYQILAGIRTGTF